MTSTWLFIVAMTVMAKTKTKTEYPSVGDFLNKNIHSHIDTGGLRSVRRAVCRVHYHLHKKGEEGTSKFLYMYRYRYIYTYICTYLSIHRDTDIFVSTYIKNAIEGLNYEIKT